MPTRSCSAMPRPERPSARPPCPRVLKRIANKVGLPKAHFHSLRHSHASLLLLSGQHLKVVQERLGHSSIAITGDLYSHVADSLQNDAAAAFDAVMSQEPVPTGSG
ncbi:MAG: site-specific integrase [Chloroflexi bacterium]|nr:site-specific integrase [Chloroflexota bacterium]